MFIDKTDEMEKVKNLYQVVMDGTDDLCNREDFGLALNQFTKMLSKYSNVSFTNVYNVQLRMSGRNALSFIARNPNVIKEFDKLEVI